MDPKVRKVLVVDDEASIREVVGSYLVRGGFAPVSAGTGTEALELFDREHPCLVILDLMLPDITGEEVCRRLRARSRVPLIMLTARVEDADAVRGLNLGADDYVTKPFSPRQLMARVEAVLRRAAGEAAPLHAASPSAAVTSSSSLRPPMRKSAGSRPVSRRVSFGSCASLRPTPSGSSAGRS